MLLKKHASSLLSNGDGVPSLEFWNGRTSGGPIPIAWINSFKKAIFHVKDGMTYGRLIGIFFYFKYIFCSTAQDSKNLYNSPY
ncbi:unnamed protein product [Camellia sinensis]